MSAAATDALCCGGTLGAFGCCRLHASPHSDEHGRINDAYS